MAIKMIVKTVSTVARELGISPKGLYAIVKYGLKLDKDYTKQGATILLTEEGAEKLKKIYRESEVK